MNSIETSVVTSDSPQDGGGPEARVKFWSQIAGIASFLDDARKGEKAPKGDRVALARLDPNAETLTTAQIAALTRAARRAKLDCERWSLDQWRRWAFIAHGIALTGHDGGENKRLGRQLFEAGVSDARVSRLLDARGPAFFQMLPRLLRLMASKGIAPNWFELGWLVLNEGAQSRKALEYAEQRRLGIARDFFSAKAIDERRT